MAVNFIQIILGYFLIGIGISWLARLHPEFDGDDNPYATGLLVLMWPLALLFGIVACVLWALGKLGGSRG